MCDRCGVVRRIKESIGSLQFTDMQAPPHPSHAPTTSATTVASAAPEMPSFPKETSPMSSTKLMAPAPSVTRSGVTESLAPRREDCATMLISTKGAPMARIVVYCFGFVHGVKAGGEKTDGRTTREECVILELALLLSPYLERDGHQQRRVPGADGSEEHLLPKGQDQRHHPDARRQRDGQGLRDHRLAAGLVLVGQRLCQEVRRRLRAYVVNRSARRLHGRSQDRAPLPDIPRQGR